jgi:hypothetical protein
MKAQAELAHRITNNVNACRFAEETLDKGQIPRKPASNRPKVEQNHGRLASPLHI